MKYILKTANYRYLKEDAEKLEKLGFKFKIMEDGVYFQKETYTSTIEINTLEDITNLIKEHGEIVIGEEQIIIYDDYLE